MIKIDVVLKEEARDTLNLEEFVPGFRLTDAAYDKDFVTGVTETGKHIVVPMTNVAYLSFPGVPKPKTKMPYVNKR